MKYNGIFTPLLFIVLTKVSKYDCKYAKTQKNISLLILSHHYKPLQRYYMLLSILNAYVNIINIIIYIILLNKVYVPTSEQRIW